MYIFSLEQYTIVTVYHSSSEHIFPMHFMHLNPKNGCLKKKTKTYQDNSVRLLSYQCLSVQAMLVPGQDLHCA